MKKILLIVHKPQTRAGHMNWLPFREAVQQQMGSGYRVSIAALSDLVFSIDGDQAAIYDPVQQFDVRDFDLVVFRTSGGLLELSIAVAAYCRRLAIPYADSWVPANGNGKLSCAFVRWEHRLPVPATLYGLVDVAAAALQAGGFGWPAVVKADRGKKGRDNHLAASAEDYRRICRAKPETAFVAQQFIQNDGDYRLLVLNGKARMAILRRAADGAYLNNTSQGGEAREVPLADLPAAVISLAEAAAAVERLEVAGVDIIIDKQSHKPYILEVNRSPQLGTGAFPERKLAHYAAALAELAESAAPAKNADKNHQGGTA